MSPRSWWVVLASVGRAAGEVIGAGTGRAARAHPVLARVPPGPPLGHDGAVSRAGVAWVGAATVAAAGSICVVGRAAWGPQPSLPAWEVWASAAHLVPVGLGCALVRAAPGSPVGPALAWVGGSTLLVRAVETAGARPGAPALVAASASGAWAWQLIALLVLLLVFPQGMLPGLPWRVVAVAGPVAAGAVTLGLAQGPPDGPAPSGWPVAVAAGGAVLLLACLATAVVGVAIRHRRGGGVVRDQVRWLLLAGGSVPVLLAAGWAAEAAGAPVWAAYTGFVLAMLLLVPAAITVAVLRHDLFDVDRLLGRSLTAALTAVVAAAGYAAVVALASALVTSTWVPGSTAAFVTALGLLPLHGRINTLVGRWTDRERTVALARVRRFVEQVRDGSAAPEEVEEVLRRALDDPGLRLGLLLPGTGHLVDLAGAPVAVGAGGRVVLRGAGTDVGVLVLGRDSARRRRLAGEAAQTARLAIEVSRLQGELRGSLAAVHASRARLVEGVAQERRRLERDLHDGAQQRVVAVGMRLRSLQRRVADPAARAELDQAVDGLAETVVELRRVAAGVRPGRLDDGLAAALEGLVRDSPVPVRLQVQDLPPGAGDETVGTTVYFVVAEALANAWKHARAAGVVVTVAGVDGRTRVEVRDDGVGGVPRDAALPALRDRVGSVGGRLEVVSPPGLGTTVTAVV